MPNTRPPAFLPSFVSVIGLAFAACSSTEAPRAAPYRHDAEAVAQALSASNAKPLTFEVLFDDAQRPKSQRVSFSGKPAPSITWVDEKRWLTTVTDPETKQTKRVYVDAATGTTTPFTPDTSLAPVIGTIPGVDREEALRIAASASAKFDEKREARIVEHASDLWVARNGVDRAVRLTDTPAAEEELAEWSPDGARVAFVSENDLWVADALQGGATRLTHDGSANVLNGKLDWLYQEEVYGRGQFRSFWWSPDSKTLAFLRLDQTSVPPYTIVDDGTYDVDVETSPYPRAGEPNPLVALRVVDVASSVVKDVDLARWSAEEPIVVNVHWSPDSELYYQVQDREQRWLELHKTVPNASADMLLLRETTPGWVDRGETLIWLADGTYLWASERTGGSTSTTTTGRSSSAR